MACAGDQRNQYIVEALALFRKLQDKAGISFALGTLGMTHVQSYVFDKAIQPLEQALAIARELEAQSSEARVLYMLGTAYLGRSVMGGEAAFDRPRELLQQSLQLFAQIGIAREKADPHIILALLGLEEGDRTATRYHMDAARRLLPEGHQVMIDLFEARYHMDGGSWAKADELLAQLTYNQAQHLILRYRARCAYEMNDYARAVSMIEDLQQNHPDRWTMAQERRGEHYRAALASGERTQLPAESSLLVAIVR